MAQMIRVLIVDDHASFAVESSPCSRGMTISR